MFRIMLSLFLINFAFQILAQYSTDSCSNQNTCHECIQSKGCVWCSKPSLDQGSSDEARCFSNQASIDCESKHVVNPQNEVQVISEKPLTKTDGVKLRTGETGDERSVEDIIQITPQKLSLKLRLSKVLQIF